MTTSTSKPSLISWSTSRGEPTAKTLVLLLHGMDCGPETVSAVSDTVAAEIKSSYLLIPKLPFRWHQGSDLRQLSEEILTYLDDLHEKHPLDQFESIRIIGHSAGGVLAQSVYLLSRNSRHALGQIPFSRIRLILIAPLSRGWTISHHLPISHKISWTIGLRLAPILKFWAHTKCFLFGGTVQPQWILQLQRGSPFLVWLRLAWLRLQERPEICVLLGSIDEIISWRDMVDEVNGADAVHLQVPFSDHAGIIDFEDARHGKERARLFAHALVKPLAEVRALDESIEPWDSDPASPDPEVQRVVFVIHGIRDEGHWTQKIAARARSFYTEAGLKSREQIAVITSSYGYFSMLEFLTSDERLLKIHWLMDQYVEAKRRFPAAKFSYIGHSNGTYLIAQALKLYPDVEFERVAFAGSVVSARYDWSTLKPQVSHVLNFTATNDWVVAIFPRIADVLPLAWLLGPNLGGAGVQPFGACQQPVVNCNNYVIGEHAAAIREENWTALARFAVAQAPVVPPMSDGYAKSPKWYFGTEWGWATSIAVWTLLLGGLLIWVPTLAWKDPVSFWGWSVGLTLAAFGLIALNQTRTQGVSFQQRERVQKVSGLIFVALALALVVGLGYASVKAIQGQWKFEEGKYYAWRMLSVIVSLWLIFKALTKV